MNERKVMILYEKKKYINIILLLIVLQNILEELINNKE